MALEAVVFQQDLFGQSGKELCSLVGGNWSYNEQEEDDKGGPHEFLENSYESELFPHGVWSSSPSSMVPFLNELHQAYPSSSDNNNANIGLNSTPPTTNHHHHRHDLHQLDTSSPMPARAKRRRSKSRKNKEEIENQRRTHIAVERNRRKQMNEYLSILRSLMPESYAQRGDQASIIGGAINFVKELEQRLQVLCAHKETKEKSDGDHAPFSEFFTLPQYSTASNGCENSASTINGTIMNSDSQSSIADIEVTLVESHANLKIRSKRLPKQLLKVVSGFHSLRFTILHLNVTTVDQTVLYSLSVKVEDDCKLTSVDEIATALYQMLGRIQEESMLIK